MHFGGTRRKVVGKVCYIWKVFQFRMWVMYEIIKVCFPPKGVSTPDLTQSWHHSFVSTSLTPKNGVKTACQGSFQWKHAWHDGLYVHVQWHAFLLKIIRLLKMRNKIERLTYDSLIIRSNKLFTIHHLTRQDGHHIITSHSTLSWVKDLWRRWRI